MGLDFTQLNSSLEGVVMQLVNDVTAIKRDLYADGSADNPGMVKKFDRYLTQQEAREIERDRAEAKREAEMKERHKQNRHRLNAIILILPVLPLLAEIGKRLAIALEAFLK